MPKPFDDAMKKLVGGNPQDMVSWVIPGAQFGKQLPLELGVENIYADGLLQATLDGKEFLAHIEFQSRSHRICQAPLVKAIPNTRTVKRR